MIPGTAFFITGLYTAMILDVYQRVHSIDKAPWLFCKLFFFFYSLINMKSIETDESQDQSLL